MYKVVTCRSLQMAIDTERKQSIFIIITDICMKIRNDEYGTANTYNSYEFIAF